ncbi:metallophosphoesterase [Amphritea sp. 1_MG-2023]|uniref:metallophosphoesterase n=1 Tax=Amphritea sp. 1_MG-2023 TaxID=3062670 RepID=UPI0026E48EA3|nr:metallophosphoesterase [Amphritea sp. 1_MG-2023]MDO6563260.1 metallophosphoesterase [Amphritea sp. 1_MG-2023]
MRPLIVAQITDCHLQNNPADDYRGRDVEQHLNAVIEDLRCQTPAADLVLWTGDLVHHGAASGYNRLRDRLTALPLQSYWLPGNHDAADLMLALGGPLNQRTIVDQHWVILLLDSTSQPDGMGGGYLASQELNFLAQQLQTYRDYHCLIVLHHNPLPVGSAWQDRIMLGNAAAFWQLLAQYPQVKGVLNGHVHQAVEQQHQGINVFMTPATSVQFKAGCQQMTLEDASALALPAYRVLQLYPDGQIRSVIKRVAC